MKRLITATAVCSMAIAATGAQAGNFTHTGVVTHVVDGDTIDVRLPSGKRERVRLIGIDAAERDTCFAAQATQRARQLALSKQVVLRGDATQDTRDRYGRLLAYVWLPGGRDLGFQLLSGGFAKVYVYRHPFQRLAAYRSAQSRAQAGPVGSWQNCATKPTPKPVPVVPAPPQPPPTGNCHPSYSPCLPIVSDLDCAEIRAMGVAPVRVLGSDPYRLDGDDDGYGCE